jgi:hypothetical protein
MHRGRLRVDAPPPRLRVEHRRRLRVDAPPRRRRVDAPPRRRLWLDAPPGRRLRLVGAPPWTPAGWVRLRGSASDRVRHHRPESRWTEIAGDRDFFSLDNDSGNFPRVGRRCFYPWWNHEVWKGICRVKIPAGRNRTHVMEWPGNDPVPGRSMGVGPESRRGWA